MSGEMWVSITEAARRLTALGRPVDRSTLSRYVSKHAEALPTRTDGKATLVEFRQLCAHREENIRIVDLDLPAVSAEPRHVSPAGRSHKETQAGGAARKANAQAEMAELDLAERKRELTPVSEVDRAARDAVALMRSAFDRAVESQAEVLALKYGWDPRLVRTALKQFSRTGLDVFHSESMQHLDAINREELAGDDPAASSQGERPALQ